MEELDFRSMRMADLSRAIGISVNAIEGYRSRGMPAIGSGRGMRYSLPDVVQWMIGDATGRRDRSGEEEIADGLGDEDLALAALRIEARDGDGVPRVTAAKALLARIEERRVPDPVADNVVAFIELANAAGAIEAAALSAPCPKCGAVVSLRKQA